MQGQRFWNAQPRRSSALALMKQCTRPKDFPTVTSATCWQWHTSITTTIEQIRRCAMNWQDRIVVDPEILVGKPVVKGTRLAVEFIIDLLAQG